MFANFKILPLFCMVLFMQDLVAQNIKSYGYLESGISTMERDISDQFLEQRSYAHHAKFSWALGLNLEYKLRRKIIIGSGIKVSALGGKDNHATTISTIETQGTINDKTDIRAYYIGMPIYAQFQAGKIGLKLGYQLSYAFYGRYKVEKGLVEGTLPPNTFYQTGKTEMSADFDDLDSGLLFGITYKYNDTIQLTLHHYLGINQFVVDLDPAGYFRINKQYTLGLQYNL